MRVLAATQGVKACIKRLIALTSIYAARQIMPDPVQVLKYCHDRRRTSSPG